VAREEEGEGHEEVRSDGFPLAVVTLLGVVSVWGLSARGKATTTTPPCLGADNQLEHLLPSWDLTRPTNPESINRTSSNLDAERVEGARAEQRQEDEVRRLVLLLARG